METDTDDIPWMDDHFTRRRDINGGMFTVYERPGWGVDVGEQAVRATGQLPNQ